MIQRLRPFYLALVLIILPDTSFTQDIIGTHEVVDFDSPEGWAMAFMTTSSLNLGQLPPTRTEFGDLSFSAEIGSIPRLNDDQQQVGFGGFKHEDLNKSRVFGRARASLGLPWDFTAELSWTPPVELEGAGPTGNGLWGLALSRPLLESDGWGLGLRLFSQEGEVEADVTCSSEVASQPPGSTGNPLSCRAPSKDQLQMDHYGFEVLLTFYQFPFDLKPWLSLAFTRIDPFVEVNALVLGATDLSTIDSKGTTETVSAGLVYQLNENWRLNLATSFTPLDVERPPGNSGGREDFWNARLGITWDF